MDCRSDRIRPHGHWCFHEPRKSDCPARGKLFRRTPPLPAPPCETVDDSITRGVMKAFAVFLDLQFRSCILKSLFADRAACSSSMWSELPPMHVVKVRNVLLVARFQRGSHWSRGLPVSTSQSSSRKTDRNGQFPCRPIGKCEQAGHQPPSSLGRLWRVGIGRVPLFADPREMRVRSGPPPAHFNHLAHRVGHVARPTRQTVHPLAASFIVYPSNATVPSSAIRFLVPPVDRRAQSDPSGVYHGHKSMAAAVQAGHTDFISVVPRP